METATAPLKTDDSSQFTKTPKHQMIRFTKEEKDRILPKLDELIQLLKDMQAKGIKL